MIDTAKSDTGTLASHPNRFRKAMAWASVAVLAILVSGFVLWPGAPLDLGAANQMESAGMYRHWNSGEVIALVRHAERCDRSPNPCIGPIDGITLAGSSISRRLGRAFQVLGMDSTDVLSSPATRTRQTAEFMFGQPAKTQDWLLSCGSQLGETIKAHKAPRRNLVLVTHSDCISDLESQLGFEHAPHSQYNSSLFVTLNSDGTLQILGSIKVEDWQQALVPEAAKL
ncbi:Ais protein, putative [Pseudomonas sp. CMR5c]|nr:Ais protein, putative [Pseudomonas sp. CMR5c]